MTFSEMFPEIAQRIAGRAESEVTLHLDKRVIDFYRSSGEDWERRINDILSDTADL